MLIPRKLNTALSNATSVYFVCPIAVGLRRSQNTLTNFVKQGPKFKLIFFSKKINIVMFALQKFVEIKK